MIVNSLLDTDFYKYTMGQLAFHQFPSTMVEWKFKCRNEASWTLDHVSQIKEEVAGFCSLKLTEDESSYLKGLNLFKDSYLEFLRLYKPNYNHFNITLEDGELNITIEGPWFLTMYFEVPVLAIVNEIYFANKACNELYKNGMHKLVDKTKLANDVGFSFADFGTRRRFSGQWQYEVVGHLAQNAKGFVGTSNVLLAKEFGVKPIGTMAHEFFQIFQAANVRLLDSQKAALQSWADEYRGNLGIALTDIINMNAFLRDFDLYFAKLFNGLRHDSGNAFIWADKAIKHYDSLGINPSTKTLVFSDGLDIEKATNLHRAYKDKINVSFGIGTNLTNNFDDISPLQIVMKIIKVDGKPVAKISDSSGKSMCDDKEYVSYLKKVFNVE